MEPNTLLRREDAAFELTKAGYRVSASNLALMASRGGGPPMHYEAGRPAYLWGDLLTWAQERSKKPRRMARSFREAA